MDKYFDMVTYIFFRKNINCMAYKKARLLIRGRAHTFYFFLFGYITNRDFAFYALSQRDKRFRSGHTRNFLYLRIQQFHQVFIVACV